MYPHLKKSKGLRSDPHGDPSLSFLSFVFLPVDSSWYVIRTNGLLDDKANGLVEKFLSVVSHDQTDLLYLTIFVNTPGNKIFQKWKYRSLGIFSLDNKIENFMKFFWWNWKCSNIMKRMRCFRAISDNFKWVKWRNTFNPIKKNTLYLSISGFLF